MKQDQMLVVLFVACCIAATGWVCQNGNWEAVLFDGESYYGTDLPDSPIWNLPSTPDYTEFRRVFHDLPAVPLHPPQITAVVRWVLMSEKIVVIFWGISIVFGLASLADPDLRSNVVLLIIGIFAYSLTIAFGMSIVFWFVFGGWGPPSPLPFAFCGIVGGTIRGWILLRRKRNR